jgi:PBSX family phage terminase large subunit
MIRTPTDLPSKVSETKNLERVQIQISASYQEVLETKKNTILLVGGRVGGKTKQVSIIASLIMAGHPYCDGVVARVNYGSLRDSSYSELMTAIDDIPIFREQFTYKQNPLRIERLNGVNNIYFVGYGGSNTSRTKGLKTVNKIGFVIFEETQELKDKRNLDEALASFRRNYGENVKVFLLGNPPPAKAHWFNQYIEEMKNDKDVLVKFATWEDIIPFLNDFDLKEILKTKIRNKKFYDWFYMGKATGGFSSIYAMFQPEKYVITPDEFRLILQSGLKVSCVVIGGDGAVNADATSFVPTFILNNGQSIITRIFYHDPKEDGILGSHSLVEKYVRKWFNELCEEFNLGTMEQYLNNPYGAYNIVPIYWRIDSAATDLIQECKYYFSNRCNVAAISKSTIMEMVSSVQSAISNDMVYIVDYGGYFDYVKNDFVKTDMNLLAKQLSLLIWNENQDKYDNSVPNDVCDAFTYSIRFWYRNVENMNYFDILKANKFELIKINKILERN